MNRRTHKNIRDNTRLVQGLEEMIKKASDGHGGDQLDNDHRNRSEKCALHTPYLSCLVHCHVIAYLPSTFLK